MKQSKFLILSIVILVASSIKTFSQVDVFRVGSGGEYLRPKSTAGSRVEGVYIDTAWTLTSVTTQKDDKLQNVLARYELRSNQLELRLPSGINVMDVRHIKSYITTDRSARTHNFINAKDFVEAGSPLGTVVEVLKIGKLSLYKKYGYYIKKPDYNPALQVGSKDEQLFIENALYYTTDKTLIELPSKKKKLLLIFGDKSAQVKDYIEKNNLSTSKESDVIRIFEYYNTL